MSLQWIYLLYKLPSYGKGKAIVWYCKSASYLVLAVKRTETKRRINPWWLLCICTMVGKKHTSQWSDVKKSSFIFLFVFSWTVSPLYYLSTWKVKTSKHYQVHLFDDSCFLVEGRGSWSYSIMYFTDSTQNWTAHVHHGFVWPHTVQRLLICNRLQHLFSSFLCL